VREVDTLGWGNIIFNLLGKTQAAEKGVAGGAADGQSMVDNDVAEKIVRCELVGSARGDGTLPHLIRILDLAPVDVEMELQVLVAMKPMRIENT
jgi:hypothetical protein